MSLFRHIAILGGGASGVVLALHLLRDPNARVRVSLVEPSSRLGRGLAYGTSCDEHVLNVPASNMSAFANAPDGFWGWLKQRALVAGDDRFVFVPRRLYGDYLGDLLAEHANDHRLTIVVDRAVDLESTTLGVDIALSSGSRLPADLAILATGHDHRPDSPAHLAIAPGSAADTTFDPDAAVLILGTGLSMVDAWLTLKSRGHRGPITALSRHGLLPREHTKPSKLKLDDVPVGGSPLALLRWFRASVTRNAGNWREIVDGLRPCSQAIWRAWSPASRRAFLHHLRPRWNVHRHRLPASLHQRLIAAIAAGELTVDAGRIETMVRDGDRIRIDLLTNAGLESRTVDRIYDCTGLTIDVEQSSNLLLRALLARGLVRPDAVRIGLDVTAKCEVIDRDGNASSRLLAIGPLTRGAFFEIEAVPDIRVQAAQLATRINASINSSHDAAIGRTRFASAPFFATR